MDSRATVGVGKNRILTKKNQYIDQWLKQEEAYYRYLHLVLPGIHLVDLK